MSVISSINDLDRHLDFDFDRDLDLDRDRILKIYYNIHCSSNSIVRYRNLPTGE